MFACLWLKGWVYGYLVSYTVWKDPKHKDAEDTFSPECYFVFLLVFFLLSSPCVMLGTQKRFQIKIMCMQITLRFFFNVAFDDSESFWRHGFKKYDRKIHCQFITSSFLCHFMFVFLRYWLVTVERHRKCSKWSAPLTYYFKGQIKSNLRSTNDFILIYSSWAEDIFCLPVLGYSMKNYAILQIVYTAPQYALARFRGRLL